MSQTKLFSPLELAGGKEERVQLLHRVVMCPLTRLRSGEEGVPPAYAATYYAQRATPGGLLITEATNISPTARGYFGAPGIYNEQQLQAWTHVTKAVHDKGGKIFMQLWHTGRVGHPMNQPDGQLPVSSSATPFTIRQSAITREGRQVYVTPRALELDEIPPIINDYRKAALHAIQAGFDGVELHAANGYLPEQFLCDGVNTRTDSYGGSIENRARFLFQALDAITSAVDSSKVGIRLSPCCITYGCLDSNPLPTYGYVVNKLNDYALAYMHLVEPRGGQAGPIVPDGGATAYFRQLYKGVVITASGYDRASAHQVVNQGHADAVAFGRAFIANPDLVARLRLPDAPIAEADRDTYYLTGERGYTDYPTLDAKA